MQQSEVRVPCCARVNSEPKRMIRRQTEVVRTSFIYEPECAGWRCVPGVRRNHIESGLQLCLKRVIHALHPRPFSLECQSTFWWRNDGALWWPARVRRSTSSSGYWRSRRVRPTESTGRLGHRRDARSHGSRPAVMSSVCNRSHSRCSPASPGNVKRNVAPGPVLAIAHNRPRCDSTIERVIVRPMPVPRGLVVTNDSKISSGWSAGRDDLVRQATQIGHRGSHAQPISPADAQRGSR